MSTGASYPNNARDDPSPRPTVPFRLLGLFAHTPVDDCVIETVNTAIGLIREDPGIPQAIKDHLTKVVFSIPDIPDVGRLAQTVISNQKKANNCVQFAKAFTEGTRFLRTSGAGRGSTPSVGSSHASLISEDSTPPPSRSVAGEREKRNRDLTNRLKERHPSAPICEISGSTGRGSDLTGAHIFPFSIGGGNKKQEHLWELLRCFWPPEMVEAIMDECTRIDGKGGINLCSNGIAMTKDCHDRFDKLRWYLVPEIGTITATEYTAVFHWQVEPTSTAAAPQWFHQAPIVGPGGYNYYRGICTGDRIVFRTVDPVVYPLPDPGLLWARSIITKIARPHGGAGDDDLSDDEWGDTAKEGVSSCSIESPQELLGPSLAPHSHFSSKSVANFFALANYETNNAYSEQRQVMEGPSGEMLHLFSDSYEGMKSLGVQKVKGWLEGQEGEF